MRKSVFRVLVFAFARRTAVSARQREKAGVPVVKASIEEAGKVAAPKL
jgi:hypothetical protein